MLHNVKELRGFAIHATDGVIGEVEDLYFDDHNWAIRYLIVDTGGWLSGRKVLISPYAFGVPDWSGRQLPVSLTKAQVEGSPDIDTRKPVSRQHEAHYSSYYGYPYYWGSEGLWGLSAYPGMLDAGLQAPPELETDQASSPGVSADAHLRSCRELTGYHLHATDGDIGHVADLLVEDRTWAIRYLVVNTGSWWSGHSVLVSPQWVEAVSWSESSVAVGLTRTAVQKAPTYHPAVPLDRQFEQAIYQHYGRPPYWTPLAPQEIEQLLGR